MQELKPLRQKIDALDDRIIELLGQRFEIVRDVAALKAEKGIPAVLPDRIEEVKARCADLGAGKGLDPHFVRNLYTVIIDYACSLEDNLIASEKAG